MAVLKPFFSYDSAIVIGSDFVYSKNYTGENFSDKEAAGIDLHLLPSGWSVERHQKTGETKVSRDFIALTVKDDLNEGFISLNAWGHHVRLEKEQVLLEVAVLLDGSDPPEVKSASSFAISRDGAAITITPIAGETAQEAHKITIDKEGISVTDTNGNKIACSSASLSLKDLNGNEIKTSPVSVSVNNNLEVLK